MVNSGLKKLWKAKFSSNSTFGMREKVVVWVYHSSKTNLAPECWINVGTLMVDVSVISADHCDMLAIELVGRFPYVGFLRIS